MPRPATQAAACSCKSLWPSLPATTRKAEAAAKGFLTVFSVAAFQPSFSNKLKNFLAEATHNSNLAWFFEAGNAGTKGEAASTATKTEPAASLAPAALPKRAERPNRSVSNSSSSGVVVGTGVHWLKKGRRKAKSQKAAKSGVCGRTTPHRSPPAVSTGTRRRLSKSGSSDRPPASSNATRKAWSGTPIINANHRNSSTRASKASRRIIARSPKESTASR